jgi:hypothetical protein
MLSLFLVMTIVLRYKTLLKIDNVQYFNKSYSSIWHSPRRNKMVLEMFICSIFMPPYVDYLFTGNMNGGEYRYYIDMFVTTFSLIKSYTLIRVYEHFSAWT